MRQLPLFAILFFLLLAGFSLAQECVIGDDDQGTGAGDNIVSGTPTRPSLDAEVIPSYSGAVSISSGGSSGCRRGGYFQNSICQLEQGASDSGAGCSTLPQEDCNNLGAQQYYQDRPNNLIQENPAGCQWNGGTNSCEANPDYESGGGPEWLVTCRGYTSGIGSVSTANSQYCDDIEGQAACIDAGSGGYEPFIYQFKWEAFTDVVGGLVFETPWSEGQTAMGFTCADYPGCTDASPAAVRVLARACSVYACTDSSNSEISIYEFALPPSASISPQSGYDTDTFEGTAEAPENPTLVLGAAPDLNWRFEAGTGGIFQTLSSGVTENAQANFPHRFYLGCGDYAGQGCVPGATLRFVSSLTYPDFYGQPTSEEAFAEAQIIIPEVPHPAPELSEISPSPSTESQSPSLQVTIPVTEGFSASSIDWKWVNAQWETLSEGTTAVSPGQVLFQSITCPIYDACYAGTTLTYYAKILYDDGLYSPEASQSVAIIAQAQEATCANGIVDINEQCDPGFEDSGRGLRGIGGGGEYENDNNNNGIPDDNECDDATQECSPYSCTCIQTGFLCGNGQCEGAESAYCPQDCPTGNETSSLIYIGFFISVLIIALAFMYSKYFGGIPHLDVFLRDEAVHLGWSVIFASMILGANFLESSNTLAGSFLQIPEGQNMYGVSKAYLDSLARTGTSEIQRLTEGSLKNQIDATDYLFTGKPFIGGSGEAKHANKKAYSQSQELATDLLMPMLISIKMQSQLLDLLFLAPAQEDGQESAPLIAIFLSIALLLRVLAPTRQAGNYLMALCFSLYVILPALYVLFSNISALSAANPLSFPVISDPHIRFNSIASLIPQAVFLPNLAIVIIVTSTHSIAAAIRGITEQV